MALEQEIVDVSEQTADAPASAGEQQHSEDEPTILETAMADPCEQKSGEGGRNEPRENWRPKADMTICRFIGI